MAAETTFGQRLLIPLDGSALAAQALPAARLLAAPGAEVLLLQALAGGGTALAEEASVRQQLAALATEVRRDRPDVRVDVVVASGNPAPAILQVAAERAVDLIVLASQGHRVPATRILGSVADQVAAATPCPILIVRPDAAGSERASHAIRRVVVPLDGSAQAAWALATAQLLATRCAAPICLLTVIDPAAIIPPAMVGADAAAAHDALAAAEATAHHLLEQLGAQLLRAGHSASWHARRGSPAEVILAAVAAGDVIVLRSRGASGSTAWPVGSVAAQILRYASTPVLLLPSDAAGRRPADRIEARAQRTPAR